MLDLSTLTHEDVDRIMAHDPTASCANCHRRETAANWWLVTATSICDGKLDNLCGTGINCDRCALHWERTAAQATLDGEVVNITIRRVRTAAQLAGWGEEVGVN